MVASLVASTANSEWEIEPIIQANIGYSDNIEFDDGDEESGFVGAVNPGISIAKTTGRFQIDLEYLMQNFYYFEDSQLDTDHDLDAIARYAIIPKTLFVNAFASATQILVDNDQQISVDNFNNTGNTTDEYSYGIGPQLVQELGDYVIVDLSYLYSEQRFDDETADGSGAGDIDDNDRQYFLGSLANQDQASSRFDWEASYEWEEVDFNIGDEFEFINQQIDAGYQLTSKIELVGSYGYEDNDLGDNVVFDDDDGTYWTAGVSLGLGEFSVLEVRRAERFFGKYWLGELSIGGPKLSLNATYEEVADISDSDDIEFGFDDEIDPFEAIDNDVQFSQDDNNSVSVSKNWDVNISYNISKSTFLLAYSNQDEEFLDSRDTELLETYSLGWIWRLSAVSEFATIVQYQEDESVDSGIETESEFLDIDVAYLRRISPKTDFIMTYIYSEGDSDFFDDDFTSNTVIAGIEHRF